MTFLRGGLCSFVLTIGLSLPLALATAPAASAAVTIDWETRATGLDSPTQVTSPRDGTGRLFVVEKSGVVRIFANGQLRKRPFLDIRSRVRDEGEGGLLSIAFHPHYRTKPYLWAAYTTNGNDVTVKRFKATTYQSNRVSPGTSTRVITVPHPDRYTNHYGGQLAFGLGGQLFLSTGDGGGSGDPNDRSQDRSSLQGKILRIQVLAARADCGRPYCVPSNNPFAGRTPGKGAIWLTGLRNPWRFSVDPDTGDLWIADVGQGAAEEVNRIPLGERGLNLGWSCREGFSTYDESRCRPGATYHEPIVDYGRGYGSSITGGFVYRGARYAALLGGRYVGGDFGSGRIFHLEGSTLVTAPRRLPGVTSFGEDGNRELWAVTYSGNLLEMRAS